MKNKVIKNIVLFSILIYPFVGGYIPVQKFLNISFNANRILFLLFFLCFIFILLTKKKIQISKITKWYLIFIIYTILNSLLHDHFDLVRTIYYFLWMFFLLLLDNLNFDFYDLKRFNKYMIIVGIGTSIVSMLQMYVNPYFYAGLNESNLDVIDKYHIAGSLYRNGSIMTGLGQNEGGIAMGMLSLIFLYQSINKKDNKSLILFFMICFSVYVTFGRYVWLMPITAILYFAYYKYKEQRKVALLIIVALGLIVTYFLVMSFQTSTIIQDRLLNEGSASGRIITSFVYFNYYFIKAPIFGNGISSWIDNNFFSGVGFGIHVGFFDILYSGGIIGLFLYCIFLYQIYKQGVLINEKNNNPIFIVFVIVFILINLTAIFTDLYFYGYIIILIYLAIHSQIRNGKSKLTYSH